MHILCLGASFTGRYLAANFPEHRISFLSRSSGSLQPRPDALVRLEQEKPLPLDLDCILDTVPAVHDSADQLYLPYQKQITQLQAARPDLGYIHISSTSVLPGASNRIHATDSVAELSEDPGHQPDSARGRQRQALETLVQAAHRKVHILRAAGIYGPGRSLVERFMAGDFSRLSTENRLVNRIHVHDLCRLVLALASRLRAQTEQGAGSVPTLLYGVDARPSSNRDVYSFLRENYVPRLPDRLAEWPLIGRRIKSRYRSDLIGELRFADYEAGFADCLARGAQA